MTPERILDAVDQHLLHRLQSDARASNAELGRELSMAPSAILERVRKLEAGGILAGYEARLSAKAVGLGLTAFVFVRAEETAGSTKTGQALAAIEQVQEVHMAAGEDCYLVKLRARDTDDLARLLREQFAGIAGIKSTRTTIVLSTLKESARLPIGRAAHKRVKA